MNLSFRAGLMATLLASAGPVAAADVTPDQARLLEQQLRAWAQGMVGPGLGLGDRPVQVTPDGERYRLTIPLGIPQTGTNTPLALTGSARSLDGGRWSFEGPRLPSPSRFTLELPTPPSESAKAQGKTAGPTIPVDYTVTVASQEGTGTFDPSFRTPSTLTTSFSDLSIQAKSDLMTQTTQVGRSAGTSTLRPSGADRVDYIIDGTIEGYRLQSQVTGTEAVEVVAKRIRVTGEMSSVSRDKISQIVPALARITGGFMGGLPKSGSTVPAATPTVDPALMRTVLASLQDLASELKLDESIDGIAVSYGGYGGTAEQLRIGMGVKSAAGLLQANMDLGLDGLALPDLPLGAMAELLPRKIALRPVLTGVPVPELMRLLTASANNPNRAGPPPEFEAMLRKGTVGAGLESFALDIGGANFAGMGKVTFTSANAMRGQAQVTATNFDALVQKANAIPELQGAVPVFLLAKGIGRTVENRIVWDITYRDNKLLVNGTDLATMMGGGGRK